MTDPEHTRHCRAIVEQFTRQAAPFARKMAAQQEILEFMLQMSGVADRDTVLDVACGPGVVAAVFAAKARSVTGIDLTPAMLNQARQRQLEMGRANLHWVRGEAAPLPFADAAFSLVITRFSLHHFLDPRAVFAEMMRVCRPHGTILAADLAPPPDKRAAFDQMEKLRDPSHTRALTPAELLALAGELGLRDIKTRTCRLALEVEMQLKSSFPNPGDDDKFREMLRADLGQDRLGVDARRQGEEIWLSYPLFILSGRK